jgi:hypothetical protein
MHFLKLYIISDLVGFMIWTYYVHTSNGVFYILQYFVMNSMYLLGILQDLGTLIN